MRRRDSLLGILLSPAERRAMEQVAKEDRRTLSDAARLILFAEFERRGLRLDEPQPQPERPAA